MGWWTICRWRSLRSSGCRMKSPNPHVSISPNSETKIWITPGRPIDPSRRRTNRVITRTRSRSSRPENAPAPPLLATAICQFGVLRKRRNPHPPYKKPFNRRNKKTSTSTSPPTTPSTKTVPSPKSANTSRAASPAAATAPKAPPR